MWFQCHLGASPVSGAGSFGAAASGRGGGLCQLGVGHILHMASGGQHAWGVQVGICPLCVPWEWHWRCSGLRGGIEVRSKLGFCLGVHRTPKPSSSPKPRDLQNLHSTRCLNGALAECLHGRCPHPSSQSPGIPCDPCVLLGQAASGSCCPHLGTQRFQTPAPASSIPQDHFGWGRGRLPEQGGNNVHVTPAAGRGQAHSNGGVVPT